MYRMCIGVCCQTKSEKKKRRNNVKEKKSPVAILYNRLIVLLFFFYSSIVFNFRFDNDIGHPKLRRNEFEQENESIVHLEVCGFLCFVRVIFSGGTDGLLSTRPTQNNWTVNCN